MRSQFPVKYKEVKGSYMTNRSEVMNKTFDDPKKIISDELSIGRKT
jgi:hypothetical protein